MDIPHYMTTGEVVLDALTPVMRQVIDAKRRHPDALILFRMGDFYELFFEDAVAGSRLLDLTLTSRNKNDVRPIPMCGFPHHQMQAYVQKVLEAGLRCAIVEQLEEASAAKGIVQRGVTHVITPGVVLETEALDARRSNRVVALAPGKPGSAQSRGGLGVAMADISTGECGFAEVQHPLALAVLLVRLEPRELVLPVAAEVWLDGVEVARDLVRTSREVPGKHDAPIDAALDLLKAYLAEVRPGSHALLETPQPLAATPHLQLNRETVAHLELLQTARQGKRQGSLLHAIDRTCTGSGARQLRALLLAPLADRKALEIRHAAVQELVEDRPARSAIRRLLQHHGDLARIATRAAAGLSTPRELAALRDTLATLPELQELTGPLPAVALAGIRADLSGSEPLHVGLAQALSDTPRQTPADGGVIRPGFDAQLDELVELASDSHAWLGRFEVEQRQTTGIATLRVTYNRVSGYGIEIGRSRADQVPAHYHRKQTLKNTERYTTDALVSFERKLAGADSERIARESELFRTLVQQVGRHAGLLRRIAHALAELDVHAGFAEIAAEQRFVRPRWVDEPVVRLRAARHPVVEQMLPAGSFVPNDVALTGNPESAQADAGQELVDEAQVLIVTGPNMAGKSTLMRQVALAVILAQAGSFVPAEEATLGVLDAVMTRIGAADDISEGASTFMVEMRETAELLQRSTARTLVLLDEIGRGTSTYDGLAIAWAVVEALHERRTLTLFATHYHELTALAERLPRLRNAHVAVREWGQDIVFVHRLQPGPTSRSHGIAVARLAGLPAAVVERARGLLTAFEAGQRIEIAQPRRQLGLFSPAESPAAPPPTPAVTLAAPDPRWLQLARAVADLDPDDLSPRQAHAAVLRLHEMVASWPREVLDTEQIGLPTLSRK